MSEPQLTQNQRELLDAIKSGVRVKWQLPCARNSSPFYWRTDNFKKVTLAAVKLLDLGLVEKHNETWHSFELRLKRKATQ